MFSILDLIEHTILHIHMFLFAYNCNSVFFGFKKLITSLPFSSVIWAKKIKNRQI